MTNFYQYKKNVVKGTVVLSKSDNPPPLPSGYGKPLLFVVDTDNYDLLRTKKEALSILNKKIDIYFDSDQNLYLNNVVSDHALMESRVLAVFIASKKSLVYLEQRCLVIKTAYIAKECREESFFLKEVDEGLSDEPHPKKRKTSHSDSVTASIQKTVTVDEEDDFDDDDFSEELGVGSVLSDESYERVMNERRPDSPIEVEEVSQLVPSAIDSNLTRKFDLNELKSTMATFFNSRIVEQCEDVMVATSKLTVEKVFEKEDLILRTLQNDLEQKGILGESDPIAVSNRNNQLYVISGSCRVTAYKAKNIQKLPVCVVDASKEDLFLIKKFFFDQLVKDPKSCETIQHFRKMIYYMNLTVGDLLKWTLPELRDVFFTFFSEASRLGRLFCITLHEELADLVVSHSENGIELPIQTLKSLLRKFKVNRCATLETLSEMLDPKTLKKELDKIQPDLRTLLSKKLVPDSLIDSLLHLFDKDEHFLSFVRGADMRSGNKSTLHEKTIIQRFESYKKSIQQSPMPSHELVRGDLANSRDVKCYITANKTELDKWLFSIRNGVGIILGSSLPCSVTLQLPQTLSARSPTGRLHNHVSVSIIAKYEGASVDEQGVVQLFADAGIAYCTIISLSDFTSFLGAQDSVYVDISNQSIIKLASHLCCRVRKVHTIDSVHWESFNNSIKKARSIQSS